MKVLDGKRIPKYLQKVVVGYLTDRVLRYEREKRSKKYSVTDPKTS